MKTGVYTEKWTAHSSCSGHFLPASLLPASAGFAFAILCLPSSYHATLKPGSQINSKKKALPCLFPPANFWGDKPGIVWWVIQHPLVLWSSALGIYWVLHRSLTKLCICQNSRFASKTLTFLFPFYLSAMCHAFLNLFIHPECALIHQEIRALWQVSWKT